MKISVVGTGYVGLVTGTCFSETGIQVCCVDIDNHKVRKLKDGIIPIYEPGLDVLFERNIREKRLTFTTSLEEGIHNAEVVFLALPTPPGDDGSADLKYVLQVAEELGPLLKKYTVIVDKSTVPVGTAAMVRERIAMKATVEFDVVSNPEFLREGVAVEDFMKPDRVVIGVETERARKIMNNLYAPLVRQGNPIIFMDLKSAELTKYAANAFLATKITFMNEIANLCELLGADVEMVRRGIGTDNRIGKRFLFAGIGYGGSCFPKDVQALAKSADEVNYNFRILQAVMEINNRQKIKLIDKLAGYFKGNLAGKTIAIWGLSFKPYTDDIREAPAIENITKLLESGASVQAYDPEAMDHVGKLMGERINLMEEEYAALENADALMIMTEWPVFRTPDFNLMKSKMREPVIFDGRNLYDPDIMKENGFNYISIGRKEVYVKK